ncbi:MAG: hypothetical protein KF836_04825 [Fimbriimonadaceae bacterium]|nr:hypothetical protein [Fimbriimonadaceae bacterium]
MIIAAKRNVLIVTLGIGLAMVAGLLVGAPVASKVVKVDLQNLEPGQSMIVGQFEIGLPSGTGAFGGPFTLGTLSRVEKADRDGHLETLWVGELNNHRGDDALLLVREESTARWITLYLYSQGKLEILPTLSKSQFDEYRGKDKVTVEGGRIKRVFPLYVDTVRTRLNANYTIEDFKAGELPVKTDSDCNADPSGGYRTYWFDMKTRTWVR